MTNEIKKNNKSINRLCKKCQKKCKQTEGTLLLTCPSFKQGPVQLTLDFKEPKKKTGS
jgi:hypothetical protein